MNNITNHFKIKNVWVFKIFFCKIYKTSEKNWKSPRISYFDLAFFKAFKKLLLTKMHTGLQTFIHNKSFKRLNTLEYING